jgi:hypothetical protein
MAVGSSELCMQDTEGGVQEVLKVALLVMFGMPFCWHQQRSRFKGFKALPRALLLMTIMAAVVGSLHCSSRESVVRALPCVHKQAGSTGWVLPCSSLVCHGIVVSSRALPGCACG